MNTYQCMQCDTNTCTLLSSWDSKQASISFTRDYLECFFDVEANKVYDILGVGQRLFYSVRDWYGVRRWPFRTFRSFNMEIKNYVVCKRLRLYQELYYTQPLMAKKLEQAQLWAEQRYNSLQKLQLPCLETTSEMLIHENTHHRTEFLEVIHSSPSDRKEKKIAKPKINKVRKINRKNPPSPSSSVSSDSLRSESPRSSTSFCDSGGSSDSSGCSSYSASLMRGLSSQAQLSSSSSSEPNDFDSGGVSDPSNSNPDFILGSDQEDNDPDLIEFQRLIGEADFF